MASDNLLVRETARYKTFLNKSDKHVLVLRFPDRHSSQGLKDDTKPTAIRIKPKSRLIEVDIPLPDPHHLDRRRAVELGQGHQTYQHSTQHAPVGIAGGFGQAQPPRSTELTDQKHPDAVLQDFDNAKKTGQALNTITYSGQFKPFSSTDPSYYLGAFRGDELHLTKVAAFCTLSAGLQHLDELDINDRVSQRLAKESMKAPEDEKATAVGMQMKAADERLTDEGAWRALLNSVHIEKWQQLQWVDELDPDAFAVYSENLLLDPTKKSNKIVTALSQQQYLDAISAPRVDPSEQGRRIKGDGTLAEDGDMDTTDASDQEDEVQAMTDVRG